jgi:phosphatidylserine decarboxylase
MATTPDAQIPYRVGAWLPSDHAFLAGWLDAMILKTHADPRVLHPAIAEFRDVIESEPEIFMLFSQMFEQVPKRPPYDRDPTGKPQVRDYQHMLKLLNTIIFHAPEFEQTGLVGCPINAILDWSMGTAAGMAAFLNARVNAQLKKVLNAWAGFLGSPDSADVLNEHPRTGWFGADARKAMPNFEREFVCDPQRPHWGYRSWDDFFTRELRVGARPVAHPEDDAVIVNACESAPYRIARRVSYRDRFWIKSQPYSIVHMLANDGLAPLFAGATVYQAYLNPLSYHRWHSPVAGTGPQSLRQGRHLLRGGRVTRLRSGRSERFTKLHHGGGHTRPDLHRSRQPGHRPHVCPGRGHGRGVQLRDHRVRRATPQEGRPARHVPLRRLHPLPDLPPRGDA